MKNKPALVESLLHAIDGSGSDAEWLAVLELRSRQGIEFPNYLLALYRKAGKWQIRSSCVFHSVRYAQQSDAAVELGILALQDKAKVVRYRACMLLACCQKKDLLPRLRGIQASLREETREDLAAAIDAIEAGNENYFVDRDHSGMVSLTIR